MKTPSWLARLALGLILALTAQAALAGATFPDLTGKVIDEAGVLSPRTEASLTQEIEGLEERTGHQVVVVTVSSLQGLEIEDYGVLLERKWRVGRQNENDGVLLIVAPKQRKVRIEVGYGLQQALGSEAASDIVANDIVPGLKAGDVDAGVTAGTEAIIKAIDTPPLPPPPPAAAAGAAPLAAAGPPAAPASPLPGGISIGSAILIALVVALLFRMLGGGKKTQVVYAAAPVLAPVYSPPPALMGARPPVRRPSDDNPLNKVMHTTIGDALGSTLGKAMGPGLIPGLLVGAGAGAGGMLLANRIRNGTWFGEGHPKAPPAVTGPPAAGSVGGGNTGGAPPAVSAPPDNTPAGSAPAAPPAAASGAAPTASPAPAPAPDPGGGATFNGGGAAGSW